MKFTDKINDLLKPKKKILGNILDLFAGCGGMSLGFESVGLKTLGFEKDVSATETYNLNLQGKCLLTELNLESEYPKAEVIIGGPPCQPFSVGGHQKGIDDSRNCLPIFIDAVKKVNPQVWMFENVRGLLYANKWYFEQAISELAGFGYIVEYKLLNASNYGVPQNRERVFVVGHRGKYTFPERENHQVTVAEAIGDLMETTPPESKFLTPSMDEYIKKYEIASKCVNPRDLYADRPARTLTCRNIAAPTGDMHRVKLSDGRRRRLSIREAARLQSFPDWFEFSGNETQQFYQIGNAVPPILARHLALSVKECILNGQSYTQSDLLKMPTYINSAATLF